jgi:glycyl-tRNA synthetase beta chain
MPDLLLEIGCEELPAWACREAEEELPRLAAEHLGGGAARALVGPRRLALLVEGLPETTAPEWVKGPPAGAPEQARAGFAGRHGLGPADLEERDGVLGFERPGLPLAEALPELLAAIVRGLAFRKSMVWEVGGLRFPRPVRWLLARLDSETLRVSLGGIESGTVTFGHRFTGHELEIPDTGAYLGLLRNGGVEPDQAERRRQIVAGLDALGDWSDPLGKLAEVVHLVESPIVLEGAFEERFLALPQGVIVTAMQSHQRYFPLGANRFAIVANGGDRDVVRAGHENVLGNRLDDARFTFERDVARGIEELAARLGSITFFQGAGSYADKTERLVRLVERLGGGEEAREAARLAKADQAAELVREFPDLEGAIGAEYARLAGKPDAVCAAIAEQYLPDGARAPLPSTAAGRILAAADKLDTLTVSFGLGHRPSGSRDPYGLRRAAIGLCRLAVEGAVAFDIDDPDVRGFVEERLEGYLDVPVELVRAARGTTGDRRLPVIADLARTLAGLPLDRLRRIREVYVRASRIVGDFDDDRPVDAGRFTEDAERELRAALATEPAAGTHETLVEWTASLAPVLERFFEDVLVMDPDEAVRTNRLRLLRDVRDRVRRTMGDLSELPG